jgi:hypothetical protein
VAAQGPADVRRSGPAADPCSGLVLRGRSTSCGCGCGCGCIHDTTLLPSDDRLRSPQRVPFIDELGRRERIGTLLNVGEFRAPAQILGSGCGASPQRSIADAVTAGVTLHWNSGGTEGAVNRIKKIKRQLYGRAGFEIRKMILLQQRLAPGSAANPDHASGCDGLRRSPRGHSFRRDREGQGCRGDCP